MRPEKANIVKDIKEQLDASPFLLVADYTGLKVDQFAELRTRLAEVKASCHVVKNTMLKLAAAELDLPDLAESLIGQTAIVTGEQDICATAKVLKVFAAEFKKPVIKIGILDNALLTSEQVAAMADLPHCQEAILTAVHVVTECSGGSAFDLRQPVLKHSIPFGGQNTLTGILQSGILQSGILQSGHRFWSSESTQWDPTV